MLAGVLMLIMLATLLGFAMASTSTLDLQVSVHTAANQTGRDQAEEILANALANLLQNVNWGTGTKNVPSMPLTGSSWNALTFDSSVAQAEGIPVSINNLSQTSVAGPNGAVAAYTAQLYAGVPTGSGMTVAELVVQDHYYNYALAATCPINGGNNMVVAALPDVSTASSDLLPGSVASNSSDQSNPWAIQLGTDSQVTGDIRAVGGIQLDPSCYVGGAVTPNQASVAIPNIYLDGNLDVSEATTVPSTTPQDLNVSSLQYCTGDLSLSGNLQLTNGILVVSGNLSVGGGIQGTGAIFVGGATTVQQSVNMQTDDTAAIVSQGDLTLGGQSQATSSFNGIVYTAGNLTAHDLTVRGCVIANSPPSDQITLQNVSVLTSHAHTILGAPVMLAGPPTFNTNDMLQNVPVGYGGGWAVLNEAGDQSTNVGNNIFSHQSQGVSVVNRGGPTKAPNNYVDVQGIQWEITVQLLDASNINPLKGTDGMPITGWSANKLQSNQVPLFYQLQRVNSSSVTIEGVPAGDSQIVAQGSTTAAMLPQIAAEAQQLYPGNPGAQATMVNALQGQLVNDEVTFLSALNWAMSNITSQINQRLSSVTQGKGSYTYNYVLNPNQFLQPPDRIHVLLWLPAR
ncbi:MAG: hypothetical protein ACYCW6_19405 [Candidatus Xenobia bacterium]